MIFLPQYAPRHWRWNLYLKAYLSFETDIVLHSLWMWNVHFSTSDHGSHGGVTAFQDMCAFVSVQKNGRQTMRRDGINDQICLQLFCLLLLSGSVDNCLCLYICGPCTIDFSVYFWLNFCTEMHGIQGMVRDVFHLMWKCKALEKEPPHSRVSEGGILLSL